MLFEKVFSFHLTKATAAASTAGYFYCSGFQDDQFSFEFSGYNEKLLLLVETTLKTLKRSLQEMDGKIFEMMKTDLMKSSTNLLLFSHCLQGSISSKFLQTDYWAAWEYERVVDKITIDDVWKLAQKYFSDAKVQILLQGNIDTSSCDVIVELFKEYFTTDPSNVSQFKSEYIFIVELCQNKKISVLPTGHSRLPAAFGHKRCEVREK